MSSITISATSFCLVGLPTIFYLFYATDFTQVLAQDEGATLALGCIIILALFDTVLASIIIFKLVQWTMPVFASMTSYIVHAVALGTNVFGKDQPKL